WHVLLDELVATENYPLAGLFTLNRLDDLAHHRVGVHVWLQFRIEPVIHLPFQQPEGIQDLFTQAPKIFPYPLQGGVRLLRGLQTVEIIWDKTDIH
ncbi:MAG: hypothetical protein ACFFD2_27790, partial [Promethearchaeota archaeon]